MRESDIIEHDEAQEPARTRPPHAATAPKRRKREKGQSLAEFAVVVPVFLILVFGIIDFSMALSAWLKVTNASREGARVLVLGQTCTQVTDRAKNVAGNLNPITITISPSSCTGSSGDAMSVTVSYTYKFNTPVGAFVSTMKGPITMTSTTTMRRE